MVNGEAARLTTFFVDLKCIGLPSRVQAGPQRNIAINESRLSAFVRSLHSHEAAFSHRAAGANIWRIAGIGRDEIRNAALLGWALDARQDHACGSDILNTLLINLRRRRLDDFPIPAMVRLPYTVTREAYSLGDGQNRVDLMIDTDDAVIIIEVKVGAAERFNQIADYLRIARQRAENLNKSSSCVIYLTPGRVSPAVTDSRLILCDWREVARAIRSATEHKAMSSFSQQALSQLARHFYGLK